MDKFYRFPLALSGETAPEEMEERRCSIRGCLGDQGVDLGIGDCPNLDERQFHDDEIRRLSNANLQL